MSPKAKRHGKREQLRAEKRKRRASERRKYADGEKQASAEQVERLRLAKAGAPDRIPGAMRAASRRAVCSVLGQPLPRRYSDIRDVPVSPFTDELETELLWAASALEKFAPELNTYIEHRTAFDRCLLRGEYASAEGALRELKSRSGVSYATLAASLLLAELTGGLRGNRAELQQATSVANSSYVKVRAAFLSQRAEKNLSAVNYDKEVDDFCRRYPAAQAWVQALSHLQFSVNFYNRRDYPELPYILYRDSLAAVQDLLQSSVRVLQLLYVSGNANNRAIATTAVRLLAPVASPTLRMLGLVLDPTRSFVPSALGRSLMTIVDAYTVGDYERSLSDSEQVLLTFPDCFELYDLYTRSLIYLRRTRPGPFQEGCLAARVLEATFDVLNRTPRFAESIRVLKKLALSLDGMRFANQLHGFVLSYEAPRHPINPRIFYELNASEPTPRHSRTFDDPGFGHRLLEGIEKGYGRGPAHELFEATLSGVPDPKALRSIPPSRRAKYEADALRREGKLEEAAQIFQTLAEENVGITPLEESAISGIFQCHIETGRLDEAAKLAVEVHLRRPQLLASVALDDALDARNRGTSPSQGIEWPILVHIHQGGRTLPRGLEPLYTAYDTYLVERGVSRPSELAAAWHDPSDPKLNYFLRHLCVLEVMDNDALAFDGTDALLRERLAVLGHLLQHDPQNAEVYQEEISRIIQAMRVAVALQRVRESKVFVDTEGIHRSLGDAFRERFARYLDFSRLSESFRETYALDEKALSGIGENTIVISDASQTQLLAMFSDLKELFVSSNEYGLDFYLSVRIRHGTLSGQLRSQFEKHQLITRKNKGDGIYQRNVHWAEQVFDAYGADLEARADELLRSFSRAVDDAIDEVKGRWIQIRGSGKKEGLFDFEYTQEELVDVFVDLLPLTEFDEFIRVVFKHLIARTERCLAEVRDKIRGDLSRQLHRALDVLSESVSELHPTLRHSGFERAITQCRTDLQRELEVVAGWFGAVNEQAMPSFTLDTLLETGGHIVEYCNPAAGFALRHVECPHYECRGTAFAPLVDVLQNLFDNVVRHSHADAPWASASVVLDNGYLRFAVENPIGPSVSREVLASHVERINGIDPLSVIRSVAKSEGGTGYHKVHKLLRFALGCGLEYSVRVDVRDERFVASFAIPEKVIGREGSGN